MDFKTLCEICFKISRFYSETNRPFPLPSLTQTQKQRQKPTQNPKLLLNQNLKLSPNQVISLFDIALAYQHKRVFYIFIDSEPVKASALKGNCCNSCGSGCSSCSCGKSSCSCKRSSSCGSSSCGSSCCDSCN